jgi:uncharacterized damage-inducible protein DinB
MKELLLQYARYNLWANKEITDALRKLQPEQVNRELVSSFPSLRTTVYHTWSAEYIWLQRLLLVEQPIWVQGEFKGTFEQACTEWQLVSQQLVQFTERQYGDAAFEHVCLYHDRQKIAYKTPVVEILMHVFNHSTYHRGQLITMLRQVGEQVIPCTDFITFARKKKG